MYQMLWHGPDLLPQVRGNRKTYSRSLTANRALPRGEYISCSREAGSVRAYHQRAYSAITGAEMGPLTSLGKHAVKAIAGEGGVRVARELRDMILFERYLKN